MWFAGVHSDVGGGYDETALSDIALLWMVHHARRYGLEFDADAFDEVSAHAGDDFLVRADSLGMIHKSRKGLYLLGPRFHRPIGRGGASATEPARLDGCEYLAETAKERYDTDVSYRSPELESYLATGTIRLDATSDLHGGPEASSVT